jgi:tripartite-type tricarboxylate transporter receptor subunit TctC
LDYASAGIGISPQLAAEMFKSMAGVDLARVPGNAEANNALLGGHVKIYFALVPAVLQHVKAGTLRAPPSLPNGAFPICRTCRPSPTGFGYEISSWRGVRAGRHAEGRRRQDRRTCP